MDGSSMRAPRMCTKLRRRHRYEIMVSSRRTADGAGRASTNASRAYGQFETIDATRTYRDCIYGNL